MRRRYDMTRSDNAPVSNRCLMPITGPEGKFTVYVGMKVCSVILIPISIPDGGAIMVDQSRMGGVEFDVIYERMPEGRSFVEFAFTVQ